MRLRIANYFTIALWVMMVLFAAANASHAQLPGKHSENIESWSMFYKVDMPNNHPLYVGIFFISGSLYLLNGDFSHIFWLDSLTGEYHDESKMYLPLIDVVQHDAGTLNEMFGASSIVYQDKNHTIDVTADFPDFCCELKMQPQKQSLEFKNIFITPPQDLKFNWYLIPRVKVQSEFHKAYTMKGEGIGHFQQYWGKEVSENGDWVVAHLDSGRDVIICDLLSDRLKLDWLPGDYIVLSSPTGAQRLIRKFKYDVLEWWEDGDTQKKYPIKISIKAPENRLSMTISAMKKEQASSLVGVEEWFGFVNVDAKIDGEKDSGWGFMKPLGTDKTKNK
jgi:hypothetical protein